MAFSHCNSSTSTLVLLLGTPFNTISHFSNNLIYLPNVLWHSRHIYQRGWSSLRSSTHTIQPAQTVSSVPSPSIISVDNNPNWEVLSLLIWYLIDLILLLAHSQNPIEVIILMSSWPTYLVNLQIHLMLIRLLASILIQEKLKSASPTSSVVLSLTSLIIFYSNVITISTPILYNLI